MIYLHPDDRAKCAAIRHVIRESALANCTEVLDDVHRGDLPSVRLTINANDLSSGESILWEFCRSISGEGPGVSMFAAKGELDDHSRRVMTEALALWFGLDLEAVS